MTDSEIVATLQTQGCDTAGALERMMGDAGFYVECLRMFAADEHFAQLKIALFEADVDAAFVSAHALKGVAGNLGLTRMFRALSTIVEPLRRHELHASDALLRDVEHELDMLRATVQ